MKKLLLFLLLCATGFAQFVEVKKPGYNLGKIKQIHVQQNSFILAAGENVLHRSTDGGKSWSLIFDLGLNKLHEVVMTDSLTGFARTTAPSGDSETLVILRTTDGGATWAGNKTVDAGGSKSSNIVFVNKMIGFFAGPDRKLYSTLDGGDVWTAWNLLFFATSNVHSMGISSTPSGPVYLAASGDSVFTTNALTVSANWDYLSGVNNLYGSGSIKFHYGRGRTLLTNNTNHVFIPNSAGVFSGVEFPAVITNASLISFSEANVNILAGSNDGRVFNYNSGAGIISTALNLNELSGNLFTNAFYAVDSASVYAAGRENYLTGSTNAGVNWQDIYGFTSSLRNPVFKGLNGVALTDGNQILYSENGGSVWKKSMMPESEYRYFNQVNAAGKNVFYASGSTGGFISTDYKLYKSTDAGKSWQRKISFNGPENIKYFHFTDENRGYSSGNGYIVMTSDGGDSWNNVYYAGSGTATAFDFRDELNGIAWFTGSTAGNSLLRTTNAGITWSKITVPNYSVDKIIYISPDTILFKSTFAFLRSTNGGANIQPFTLPVTGLYVVTDFGKLGNTIWVNIGLTQSGRDVFQTYYSLDFGATWNLISGSALSYMAKINEYMAAGVSNKNQISKLHLNSRNVLGVNNYNALKNDTVTVEIMYSPSLNSAISAIQFEITGYGDKLQFLELDTVNTDLSAAGWMYAVNPSAGRLRLAMSGSKYLTFGGVLARVKYKVIDSTGTAPLNLTQVLFNTGITATDTANGFVKIDRINPGDVDLNGSVQAFDAGMVLKFLTNQVYLSSLQKRNANVTTDDEINAFDASVILRYVVGLITSLPYGGTDNSTADYIMNNFNALPGSIIEVPLNLVNASGIYSADGYFTYDPSKLTFTEVVWDAGFSNFLKEVSAADGKINFAIAASQKKDLPSGMFAKIRFTVNNSAATGSSTSVDLSKIRLNQNPASLSPVSSVISIVTSLDDEEGIPQEFELSQNYPNPFNPSTVIKYSVPEESQVRIRIFDISGAMISEPVNAKTAPGNYSRSIDLGGRASGVYICRMEAGGKIMNIKMNLLK